MSDAREDAGPCCADSVTRRRGLDAAHPPEIRPCRYRCTAAAEPGSCSGSEKKRSALVGSTESLSSLCASASLREPLLAAEIISRKGATARRKRGDGLAPLGTSPCHAFCPPAAERRKVNASRGGCPGPGTSRTGHHAAVSCRSSRFRRHWRCSRRRRHRGCCLFDHPRGPDPCADWHEGAGRGERLRDLPRRARGPGKIRTDHDCLVRSRRSLTARSLQALPSRMRLILKNSLHSAPQGGKAPRQA